MLMGTDGLFKAKKKKMCVYGHPTYPESDI
jgi:hypothetical protein